MLTLGPSSRQGRVGIEIVRISTPWVCRFSKSRQVISTGKLGVEEFIGQYFHVGKALSKR